MSKRPVLGTSLNIIPDKLMVNKAWSILKRRVGRRTTMWDDVYH